MTSFLRRIMATLVRERIMQLFSEEQCRTLQGDPQWFVFIFIIPKWIKLKTYFPIGGVGIMLKVKYSNTRYGCGWWVHIVKLLSGQCHRIPMFISQCWFSSGFVQLWKRWLANWYFYPIPLLYNSSNFTDTLCCMIICWATNVSRQYRLRTQITLRALLVEPLKFLRHYLFRTHYG